MLVKLTGKDVKVFKFQPIPDGRQSFRVEWVNGCVDFKLQILNREKDKKTRNDKATFNLMV